MLKGAKRENSVNNSDESANCGEFSQRQIHILELKLISKDNEEIAKMLGLTMDELEREIGEITKLFDKKKKKG